MNQLDTLKIFQRVAELASFSGAARQLGLPNASVSLAVQQLEQMLGTRLLQRTTRRVQLTADGEAFYRRSQDLLDEFESLRGMFRAGGQPLSGKLRVDMSSAMAREVVLPALPTFLARHPQLEIELSASDRRVDLVAEGFDCVLRTGTLDDSSLVARPIGHLAQINCASAAYLKKHGTPRTLEDLAHHQLVHYRQVLGGRSPGWEWFDGTQTRTLPMAGSVTVNSTETYYAACQAGLGLIQLPLAGALCGMTTYMNADVANRRVEIGSTWYAASAQRTGINTECKLMLLTHAFEDMHCIAVEFRTHWMNQQSRAAIARLGAKQDGILRNHQRMPDGSYRDTVVFSIIESEWPTVRRHLQFKLGR